MLNYTCVFSNMQIIDITNVHCRLPDTSCQLFNHTHSSPQRFSKPSLTTLHTHTHFPLEHQRIESLAPVQLAVA